MHRISLGYNAVPPKAYALIKKVWKSGQFSPGPMVREFEEKMGKLHNAKHAVFVNSGTDALRLSLLAMKEKCGWKDGDRVFVPTITFVATINVVLQAGLKPHLIDVGLDGTMNMDRLEHFYRCMPSFGDRARAIMLVHMFGKRPNIEKAKALAKKHKLKIVEDSCETILNPVEGDVSCHSTYMAHHVTTGVGGFALTNDAALNMLIRSYANHGRNVAYLPGYKSLGVGIDLLSKRFRFDRIGYSNRGTEFEAALGIAQLDELTKQVEQRRYVAQKIYDALFRHWVKFNMSNPALEPHHTFMMYPIIIKENSKTKKYDLCLHLEQNGIETRNMMPITTQPCYKTIFSAEEVSGQQVADLINRNGFYIPCHPGMTSKDIGHIGRVFSDYLK